MTKNQLLEFFPLGPEIPDHRLFDPVTAIAGGVGLLGNVVGGFMGKSAANKAGEIQQKAAIAASDKVGQAVSDANAPIADATKNAQTGVTSAGNQVMDAGGVAKAGVDNAARNGNALLDPYATAGGTAATVLNAGIAPGGDFNHAPTLAELQMDPGYAFRQQQGELALQRSGAAHGGALGGGAVKEALKFNSGLASQEYQNAFQRFQDSTQNRFKNVLGVSEQGRLASTTESGNLMDAGKTGGDFLLQGAKGNLEGNEYAGKFGLQGAEDIGGNLLKGATTQADLLTGGAAAKAAGVVGGSNAMTAGIAGGANAVTNAATLNLLKNPATSGYYSSSRGYVRT